MAKGSIRHMFRKKHADKKALSPEMRDLMVGYEAQYGQRHPHGSSRSSDQESRDSGAQR